MGCGLCKHVRLQVDTDLTLHNTGLARYDSIFQELERPLHKVQQAKELLSDRLFAFKSSVGLYPRLPLSTFLDAALAMLLCYSASSAGRFEEIGLLLTPEVPYLQVNISALQREHQQIPVRWEHLLRLAEQIKRELEGLTPIITAAANDMLSTGLLRSPRNPSRGGLYAYNATALSVPRATEPRQGNNSAYHPE